MTKRKPVAGLPGGGPWLILDDCLSGTHNSARAAQRGEHRCHCPRALVADGIEREKRAAADIRIGRPHRQRVAGSVAGGNKPPLYETSVRPGVQAPDFSRARCTKPYGMKIMDEARASRWSGKPLQQARAMCSVCPIKIDCKTWIEKAELPPGSWSGIYAGETHMQRAARAKKAKGSEAA